MNDMDIVSAVLALLADKLGSDRYELWFGPTTRVRYDKGIILVEAPNRFTQNWLRSHYRGALEAAGREVMGSEVAVEFRVDESLAGKKQQTPPRAAGAKPASLSDDDAQEHAAGRRNVQRSVFEQIVDDALRPHPDEGTAHQSADARQPAARKAAAATAADRCPPGEPRFSRRRFAILESFVVGPCNHFAHATAQMVAQRPGSLTPLLFYGPTGCGKTHLLEGMLSRLRAARRNINAVFVSAEQFTTFFLESLHGSGLPNFRRKYRGVEVLILDDLQFLAGKKATLVELLQTIDALVRDGRQLVFSADRGPAELRELGPELSGRLSGGMVCRLDPPDHATRVGLALQFARRLEIDLPHDAAHHIATLATGNAREISGAVHRVHAASRILGRPIDLALAQESLAELFDRGNRAVRLADIEKAVCDVFGVSQDKLQSAQRAKHVSTARMLAMWLARKHTRAGLSEIGEYFGRRSHSTVISAHKRVRDWLADQAAIDLSGDRCPAAEAVRRVEQQLRVS